MKRLLLILVAILALTGWLGMQPAWAGDAAKGAQVFAANCASCHLGGKNIVNAAKTLNKGDLDKNGMNSADAIVTQVTKGKNAMPSFAGRLTEEQIDNVAAYVLAQADKGW